MAIKFGKTEAAKAKAAPKPSAAKRKTQKELPIAKPAEKPKPKAWRKAVERKRKAIATVQPDAVKALFDGSDTAVSKLRTFDEFMAAGHRYMRRTVEGVFYFSALVLRAKEHLTKDEFNTFIHEMSLASTSASQYMTIAKSERLKKLKDAGNELPTTSTALYLIASMDEAEYKALTKKHDIDARLGVDDLREFRTAWKDRANIAHLPKTTRQAAGEAAREFTENATAPVDDDQGAFQTPHEPGEPEGSPNLSQPSTAVLTTARELGEGILAIAPDDLVNAVNDLPTATDVLAFVTRLVEHVELMRTKLADREFDLQDEAAA